MDDNAIIDVLAELVERYPRYGFRKMFKRLRLLGHSWNQKWVYRVYCDLKLNLRCKHKTATNTGAGAFLGTNKQQ